MHLVLLVQYCDRLAITVTVLDYHRIALAARVGTFPCAGTLTVAIDPVLLVDRTMEKAVAYAISALLVGFGAWILVVGLSSSSPALWTVVALVPITIGIVSAFGPM